MSKKKKVGIVVLVIVALPFVYWTYDLIHQNIKTQQAKAKVTAARQAIEEAADKKVSDFETALTKAKLVGAKIGSSKVDVCYVTHADSGWFAQFWYQECYLRYVSGFYAAVSKNDLKKDILKNPAVLAGIGGKLSNMDQTYKDSCEVSDRLDYEKLSFLPKDYISDEAFACSIPDQNQGINSVEGPIGLDNELSVNRYYSLDTYSVKNRSQIWLEHDEDYYHEHLGCGFGIFCENPRSKPAH